MKNWICPDCKCECEEGKRCAGGVCDCALNGKCKSMRKIKPTIFNTPEWKKLEESYLKSPKVEITPLNRANKDDRKKARLLQKLINYMFEHDTNGVRSKYHSYMKQLSHKFVQEEIRGIQINWDATQRTIDQMTKDNL
jgi:ribosomal protein S20